MKNSQYFYFSDGFSFALGHVFIFTLHQDTASSTGKAQKDQTAVIISGPFKKKLLLLFMNPTKQWVFLRKIHLKCIVCYEKQKSKSALNISVMFCDVYKDK